MARRAYFPVAILFLFVAGLFVAQGASSLAAQQPAGQAAPVVGAPPPAEPAAEATAPSGLTLTTEQRERAIAYRNATYWLYFIGFAWGVIVFLLILRWKCGPRFRDMVEKISRFRYIRTLIFVAMLFLTLALLNLPADIYGQYLSLSYDQSVQSWPSWFWDWTKGELLGIVIGSFLIWILYSIISRNPRSWWFRFWLISLPILVLFVFIAPVVFVPLFNKFEPLAPRQPALVERIEQVTRRGGLEIPRDRMFEMIASEKTKVLNAGVMGLGASKRVVFYDNILVKMNHDQSLLVFGHEMGHYVLGHTYKLLGFIAAFLFVSLYLGYRLSAWMIGHCGQRWGIRSMDDLASLPVLLLLLSVLGFLVSPIQTTFSRSLEHEADIYGLEVTHDIVPNAGAVAAQAFQILGETNLADPDPHPFIKMWLYTHPPLNERIAFVSSYDPWSKNEPRKFVKD